MAERREVGKSGWGRSGVGGNLDDEANYSCTSYEFLYRVPEATLCCEHNLQMSNLWGIKFSSCGDESFKIAVVVWVVFSSTLTTPHLLNVPCQVVKFSRRKHHLRVVQLCLVFSICFSLNLQDYCIWKCSKNFYPIWLSAK